jgi:hypothetical protein
MTKNCVATVTTGCAFPFSQIPQETERWRAMHSPGVRVYEGHAFRQRSPRPGGYNPLPELAVAKSRWLTADRDDALCRRHNTCPSGAGIMDAVILRLHHLRRHVPCAMQVHRRHMGADGLDECPRHRRHCQGQAEPALTKN